MTVGVAVGVAVAVAAVASCSEWTFLSKIERIQVACTRDPF